MKDLIYKGESTMINDLIRRQAAINAIENTECELLAEEWDELTNAIKQVQSAQQWIPVTERPPEDLKPVNITYINEDPAPYYEHIKGIPFTATAIYYRGGWYWWSCTCVDVLAEYGHSYSDSMDEGIEVKAWMPLPDPYEEDCDE